ncbi:MAG: nickel-dependent lactate racemase [Desulfobacteraceae bacterium]|nr:MAG: nickel-dependent lactate racemase [Desulfobacteraceae bacterium]
MLIMLVNMPYNNRHIEISVPDDAAVYRTSYREPENDARNLVINAVRNPVNSLPLSEILKKSGVRSLVIVVSDITRPIPYADFLDAVLEEIEDSGVGRENIIILIATGMHRPSTAAEQEYMFGRKVCKHYRIMDHRADKPDGLVRIPGRSRAGRPIELNRHFIEADFRIITGLVEPHFMAGFSGGRKAICPGLCSLDTVKIFHSFGFLDDPCAVNGNLEGNPLHYESLSIARQADAGFAINLVVDRKHRVAEAVAGDLEASHEEACRLVNKYTCPPVAQKKDVVITSSGGYPLDATFYQCVKGMVSCLPAVKKGGVVVSAGSCSEGIGSDEYQKIMHEYSGRWGDFLDHIKSTDHIIKDQWQFQMQTKTLQHVGDDNLIFVTGGLKASDLARLSVKGIDASEGSVQENVQKILDGFIKEGRSIAVIPEGPYCAPCEA